MDDNVTVTWLGHSMFLLEGDGIRLVTDPVDPSVGYHPAAISADIVTVSHEHFDHSNLGLIRGDPVVVDSPGSSEAKGIAFEGFKCFHDKSSGRERGGNIIFTWELGNVRFIHLGDLGDRPGDEVVEKLKGIDVLMVPVGGVFTIDGDEAAQLVEELSPRVAIPMHYKTPHCSLGIDTAGKFVRNFEGRVVEHEESPTSIAPGELPDETQIWVLPYLK